jgi:SAM-dependent methyltransferase
MLKDAALLQLELIDAALDENMSLKDASSFNVQWKGARPVFIDIPSFEPHVENSPWIGYRQFCKLFLYPLFLQAYKDIPFHSLLRGNIDGIDAEDCSKMMSVRDRFRPGVFMDVYMQAKLQSRYADSDRAIRDDLRESGFSKQLIKANIRRLRNVISSLRWRRSTSQWSDYASHTSYTNVESVEKAEFVRSAVGSKPRRLVWDIGCNTGRYSRIAAEQASYVVAMDYDHLAVERFYQELKEEGVKSILPLVINVADASPNLGWRGLERKGLVERGTPDLTLCLALIHHVVITSNVPMMEFLNWLASLGTDLVIEFVAKDDPMVKKLLMNRNDQYAEYTLENCEKILRSLFKDLRKHTLASGTRVLFHAVSRNAASGT